MPNALMNLGGPPAAPNPLPQSMPQGGMPMGAGGPPTASGNPMMPGAAPQQAPPPPPPNHQQTLAALRHFSAIERELTTLLTDPDLGKADMKSKIIDGATSLVADGIVTPAQAVAQLGTVPERPFEQKQWIMKNFSQVVQAQTAVVAQHQAGFANTPMPPPGQVGNPDNHLSDVAGLMAQYNGAKNG